MWAFSHVIKKIYSNKIFGKYEKHGDERVGSWRKLHNEELHNLYCSPSIIIIRMIKEDETGKACSTHGGKEECILGFGGKARRKETTRKTQTSVG
jgi:hypothetical protein